MSPQMQITWEVRVDRACGGAFTQWILIARLPDGRRYGAPYPWLREPSFEEVLNEALFLERLIRREERA